MTFGEHLDELRRALLKAVTALVIGVLIGLIFGQQLVDYIQTPLQRRAARITTAKSRTQRVSAVAWSSGARRASPCRQDIDAAVDAVCRSWICSPRSGYVDIRQLWSDP